MADVNAVWQRFSGQLACVDEEYLKRAFILVWRERGRADQEVAFGMDAGVYSALQELDDPFPEWEAS